MATIQDKLALGRVEEERLKSIKQSVPPEKLKKPLNYVPRRDYGDDYRDIENKKLATWDRYGKGGVL